jgi:hypothetical protein
MPKEKVGKERFFDGKTMEELERMADPLWRRRHSGKESQNSFNQGFSVFSLSFVSCTS